MSKKKFSFLLSVAALASALVSSPAHALNITPSTPGIIEGSSLTPPTGSSNCEVDCVYNAFGLTNDGSLTLLYKADQKDDSPAEESGSFKESYSTVFLDTPNDPSGATITYNGLPDPSISCPNCYLAIKDGNHAPTYYFYNLSGWNGTETLNLSGFWPDSGAISHVSIWGSPGTSVPEPASLLLLGAGLAGLGIWRRKQV